VVPATVLVVAALTAIAARLAARRPLAKSFNPNSLDEPEFITGRLGTNTLGLLARLLLLATLAAALGAEAGKLILVRTPG